MNNQQKEDTATLEILQAIEDKRDVTQRHLADRLDVALGLANSYLKRCVHKGLVKIHQAPANRYFYYLTPKGFAEKSRLTTEFLSSSLSFYRRASSSFADLFELCEEKEWERVLLCGVSDMTEIASLRAQEFSIEIENIFNTASSPHQIFKKNIITTIDNVDSYDAYVLTALHDIQEVYKSLRKLGVPEKNILIPEVLNFSPIPK